MAFIAAMLKTFVPVFIVGHFHVPPFNATPPRALFGKAGKSGSSLL